MRIAVDARPLNHPRTGIGRYTFELLRRMVDGSVHEWWLLGGPRAPGALDHPGVRHLPLERHDPLSFNRAAAATLATGPRPDVFWSPRHHLPRLEVPTVVTVHDLVWRRRPLTMRASRWAAEALAMPRTLRRANRVIAVSESTAADLAHFHPVTAGRVTVVHPGADHLPRDGLPAVAHAAASPYALFVGTFEPRKNIPRLLQALRRVVDSGIDSHRLILAGVPGWRTDVRARLRVLRLEDRVELCGAADDVQLAGLYFGADFLALPSLYEGFGLPIAEAMTFGKPVLTSNVASMPEVAGPAGLLVDPYDVTDIAAGLARLIADRDAHAGLSAAAPAAAARFRWEVAAIATLDVLEQAAADGAHARRSG